MGQKTHPLGFRLGITQEHKANWYTNLNSYKNMLKEDDKIRTYLNKISKKYHISNVKIDRNGLKEQIEVIIETGRPGFLIGKKGKELQALLKNIKNILPSERQLVINVFEIKFRYLNAGLIADDLVKKLEKRVPFRRAIRDVLLKSQKQNVKGIKIQVSGRLNGAEIARSEWIREGRVPLQTLRAEIDYATQEANTIYGILGIKVWIFKSEIIAK